MRLIVVALALLAAPAFAQELQFPDELIGRWETIPENCTDEAPSEGVSLELFRDEEGDSLIYVDWSTEGGYCTVEMIDGTLPNLTVYGNCGAEEGPSEAAEFRLRLADDGLLYDGKTFKRCD